MNSTTDLNSTLPLIVQILLRNGRLEQKDLETLREAQAKERLLPEEILVRKGFASEREIAAAYSEYYLIPLFEPGEEKAHVNMQLLQQLTEKLCRDHLIAPLAVDGNTLDVAFFTPNELHIVDELQLITGLNVHPLIAPLSVVEGILGTLYDDSAWPGQGATGNSADFEQVDEGDEMEGDAEGSTEVVHLDQPPPPGRDGRIIRFVNQVLEQAFRAGASDIHIEPFEDRSRVRLRIDGSLTEITPPPQSLYVPIVSRIKVLAKLDIAEKRVPQDGAIALRTGDRRVDVRVSTVPTVYGEKVVLRVLDKSAIPLHLSDLGLDERVRLELDYIHHYSLWKDLWLLARTAIAVFSCRGAY